MYFSVEEKKSKVKKKRVAIIMRVNTMLLGLNSSGITILATVKLMLEKQVAINKRICAANTERIMFQR